MILSLPDELVMFIASFLELRDQARMSSACRRLREVAWDWHRTPCVYIRSLAAARSFAAFCHRNATALTGLHLEFTLPNVDIGALETTAPFPGGERWPIDECVRALPTTLDRLSFTSAFDAEVAALARLGRLQALYVDRVHGTRIDLSPLRDLHLTFLDLSPPDGDPDGDMPDLVEWTVDAIALPHTLRELNIAVRISPPALLFAELRGLTNLGKLIVFPQDPDDDAADEFREGCSSALDAIHVTHLMCCTDELARLPASVVHLGTFWEFDGTVAGPHVTELDVFGGGELPDLRGFSSLRDVHVYNDDDEPIVSIGPGPSTLTRLSLGAGGLARLPDGLHGLSSLRCLDLHVDPTVKNMAAVVLELEPLTHLETIDIRGPGIEFHHTVPRRA